MSDSQGGLWSDNPNAPKIPVWLYFAERYYSYGIFFASILYGVLIILFFRCITALLNPANRRGAGIKWWLVAYTVLAFAFATIINGTDLDIQSICYVDNREFPGVDGVLPPGPLGYKLSIRTGALSMTNSVMFFLGHLLADGFLLYRCYVICSENFQIVAFPCLMYLGSLGIGATVLASQAHAWANTRPNLDLNFRIAYTSISLSLNVLLTLMILVRLVLRAENVRAATGSPAGLSRLYKTIATVFIESSALYAVNSLLLIGVRIADSSAEAIFLPVLGQVQVIAPLLIVQRIANKSALTDDTITTGQISSFNVKNQTEPADGVAIESVIDFRRGKV